MRERNQKNFARARVSENPPISRQNNPHLLVVLADFAETTLAPVKVELCNANIISQTKERAWFYDENVRSARFYKFFGFLSTRITVSFFGRGPLFFLVGSPLFFLSSISTLSRRSLVLVLGKRTQKRETNFSRSTSEEVVKCSGVKRVSLSSSDTRVNIYV